MTKHTTEPRSAVLVLGPLREGNGTAYMWTRRLIGKLYSFHMVIMPDGELRYEVRRYDGPTHLLETGTFDCDWTRLHFLTCLRVKRDARYDENSHEFESPVSGRYVLNGCVVTVVSGSYNPRTESVLVTTGEYECRFPVSELTERA